MREAHLKFVRGNEWLNHLTEKTLRSIDGKSIQWIEQNQKPKRERKTGKYPFRSSRSPPTRAATVYTQMNLFLNLNKISLLLILFTVFSLNINLLVWWGQFLVNNCTRTGFKFQIESCVTKNFPSSTYHKQNCNQCLCLLLRKKKERKKKKNFFFRPLL